MIFKELEKYSVKFYFSSPDPNSHVGFCHHLAYIICLSAIDYINFDLIEPFLIKLGLNVLWIVHYKICISKLETYEKKGGGGFCNHLAIPGKVL
jgi:hypothetical protein